MAKKFSFIDNRKNNRDLLTIHNIVKAYNSLLYKYTGKWSGRIANVKTEILDIPNKYITIGDYIRSKKIWVQILTFSKQSDIININDYIDVMFRNWNDISMFIGGMENTKKPIPQLIFSIKMKFKYEELSFRERESKEMNKHLNLNKSEDFYLLNKTLQQDINSLFKLKKINTDLSFYDIINIFSGEFDEEFKLKVLAIPEIEITEERIMNIMK